MSTSKSFISQTFWYTISKYSQVLVQFIGSIIFARILNPSDFGLVGMAMGVLGIGTLFADFGMPTAYIQRERVDRGHNRALFIYTALITLLFLATGIYLSSYISLFYNNSDLDIVSKLATVSVSLVVLTAYPLTILKRALMFEKLAAVSFLGLLVSISTILYFALKGYGFLSLIYGPIARNAFCLVLYYYITLTSGLVNKLESSKSVKESFFDLFDFGKWITANRILTYFGREIDTVLIGKYFGSTDLGLYNRAYNMMLLPLRKFSAVISGVSLATLNKHQRDNLKLWNAFRKIITIELMVLIPIVIIAWTYRYELIVLLYSDKWIRSADYLTYLFPVVLIDLFRSTLAQSLVIKGYVRSQLAIGIITSAALLLGILFGISHNDIVVVVISYSLVKVIIFFPTVSYYTYSLDRRFRDIIDILGINARLYWPIFLIAASREIARNYEIAPTLDVFFAIAFIIQLYISSRMILTDSDLKFFSNFIKLPRWIFRLLIIKDNR